MSEETFQSSKDAYEWCLKEGLVSKRVAEVLKVITDSGPLNQTLAHQAIARTTGQVGLEKYAVSPRFAVLERMGLIREAGRRKCPISGRMTVFYESTCMKPKCTEKEASSVRARRETTATLKRQLADALKENATLREVLNLRSRAFEEREAKIKAAAEPAQPSFL